MKTQQERENGTLKTYSIGLALCVALTLGAFYLVSEKLFSPTILIGVILFLALIQAAVQLVLFLHLGFEGKPHWNLTVFLFMLLVLVIFVFGSIWIMYSLNYRMM
jgi:cytochrome o ubiquinol oxidase operon protein cyoD